MDNHDEIMKFVPTWDEIPELDETDEWDIRDGTVFDTPYETNCVATGEPDDDGNFTAFDSDGVECTYTTEMVTKVH